MSVLLDMLRNASSEACSYALSQLIALTLFTVQLKNNILLLYPSDHNPLNTPPILPNEAKVFLGRACRMNNNDVEACWDVVKDLAWQGNEILDCIATDQAMNSTFAKHGGKLYRMSSICSLFPPTFFCINSGCKYVLNNTFRKLQTAVEHEAILYTSSVGPIPVQTHQFTCNGCGIVYHPDYFVQTIPGTNDRRRVYYNEDVVPQVLQVSTHHFVETSLVRMWRSNMLHAWVSASNTVKVYDSCWPEPWAPPDWTVSANLRYEYVYNGFKLLSLLEWHKSHLSILMVHPDTEISVIVRIPMQYQWQNKNQAIVLDDQ
ncbi:hypothetical protein BT96DRAFT_880092 [Gymnopus androsaceus JB14]|uniref:CxC5 like cysteine cluster associated with KDZ domain-containing protein n=1 Tax=Gymnopus androsaceus JB14 TaxID=1447944 RepID=A0A6A4HY31_9AGAR|nr:hypothetical protein BT96DRAFT_880092 [Gymnopus androsaceus JB14]